MTETFWFPYQRLLCLTIVCLWLGFFQSGAYANPEKSLYERLGGYDAISAVVDVFLKEVWADPIVGRFLLAWEQIREINCDKKTKTFCASTRVGLVKKLIAL